jgi:hypothetical protein
LVFLILIRIFAPVDVIKTDEIMKKVIALIVFFAAITMSAHAQIQWGVKGGLNVSSLSVSKDVIDPSNQVGFFIGPMVKFTLPVVGLGVDAAALYDQRSSDLEGVDKQLKEQSLQIPVNLRYSIGLSSLASVYFFAGPQFGFNLGSKTTDILNNGAEWRFNSSNLSANIGAGVVVMKHIQASLNYNFALGKTGEFNVLNAAGEALGFNGTKIDGRMNAWQLSVAYIF